MKISKVSFILFECLTFKCQNVKNHVLFFRLLYQKCTDFFKQVPVVNLCNGLQRVAISVAGSNNVFKIIFGFLTVYCHKCQIS